MNIQLRFSQYLSKHTAYGIQLHCNTQVLSSRLTVSTAAHSALNFIIKIDVHSAF